MAKQQKKKKNDSQNLWRDERARFIIGAALVLISIFLIFSIVSHFFSWKNDQNISMVTDSVARAENSGGNSGLKLASFIVDKGFGFASIGVPLFMAILGLSLLKIRGIPFLKTLLVISLSTIVVSITLGFIDSILQTKVLAKGMGGAHGHFVSDWLQKNTGITGTVLILIFSIVLLAIFINKNTISLIERIFIRFARLFKHAKKQNPAVENNKKETEKYHQPHIETEEEDDSTKEEEDEKDEYISIKKTNKTTPIFPTDIEINKPEEDEFLDPDEIPNTLYDPTLDLSSYKLPPVDLLDDYAGKGGGEMTTEELERNKNKIVETLSHYKIGIKRIIATPGPTVTLYEIVPSEGIRIATIKRLEDDIALSLSALSCRIIAPIPGKGTVGIEIPNENPAIVSMKSLVCSKKFQESRYELPVVMGKTISNETFTFDLCKMPHLLVAGATGQGKSVGLNAIINSLLYKKHPSQLKFVMVDPKKVELTLYSKLEHHFLAKLPDADEAVITENQKVIHTLKSLCIEMDNRYALLKDAQLRNIKEYNDKFINRRLNPNRGHKYLPYIVVIIDEFADLIMTAGREVEEPIARLAQLARAIGIHLVIATQRPTTNIITGLIKANFPARIAFRVTMMIDSRTILDQPGANQLVGRGDMLISTGSELTRLQCALIETDEVEKITSYISKQQGYPTAFELPEYTGEDNDKIADVDTNDLDKMFDEAARIIVAAQQGSTSLIQRKLSLGYNRAGRIMDQLEATGIVGPYEGSKARQVLITDLTSLDQILADLKNR
ncbi:MAG: DNA translocase FtsK [Prevotellaceae bacterium]|jgi:S-DNA-T family DNA segregation ATPase FtsK/SpoIIIE|nr:DNA translocase FtsK [Prevotellaceae bacterium]